MIQHVHICAYIQWILVNPPQFVFKEYGGLTGYSLVLVHYIDAGKQWWINENLLHNNYHTLAYNYLGLKIT